MKSLRPEVPPIDLQRARDALAAQEDTSWTGENFHGTSFSEILNPYTDGDHLQTLQEGGTLFSFACRHELSAYQAEMVDLVLPLSAFDDQVRENCVPHFVDSCQYREKGTESQTRQSPPASALDSLFGLNILDIASHTNRIPETVTTPIGPQPQPEEPSPPYSFLLARTAYLLVDVDLAGLLGDSGPSIVSSADYQQACEPTGTLVWTDHENMEPNNFRITKPIVPYVYDMTVQFRVSSLTNQAILGRLGRHVGTLVDGGILLERTKRSKPPKEDATKIAKSVLLYTDLGDHVTLVTHLTVVLQRGLPAPVERLIQYLPNQFQSWGLGEACETAWNTNRYLRKLLPAAGAAEPTNEPDDEASEDEFVDARSFFD